MFSLIAGVALPGQQRRDSSAAASGTSVISGTVVSRENDAPVRGARVALSGGSLEASVVVTADDDGVFRFDGLAPGAYRLWAVRAGFLTASYGEKRPGSGLPGTRIVVGAGQRVERLRLQLPRGGVISGVALDANGEPVVGAMVIALRAAIRAGRSTMLATVFQETDDRGIYRLHGLPPGEYVVASMSMGLGLFRTMQESGGFDGAPGHAPAELFMMPDYLQMNASPTLYPGGSRFANASRITIGTGEERAGIDIRLSPERGVRVSGVVREADGSVPTGDAPIAVVLVNRDGGDFTLPGEFFGARMAIVKNGQFELANVEPGEYELKVNRPGADSDVAWAVQTLTVQRTNVDGVVLTLQPGLTLTISLEMEGGPSSDIAGLILTRRSDSGEFDPHRGQYGAELKEGRFVARGLLPGNYRVSIEPTVPGWRLASVMYQGRDALDFSLDVEPGDNPPARAILTRSTTEISGRIAGALEPATSYFVVAFAGDERYWIPESRRNVAVEADPQGRFTFQNLPAGRYRLAVLQDFDSLSGVYPALLRQLAANPAVEVSLADGGKIVQDLLIKK